MLKIDFRSPDFRKKALIAWAISMVISLLCLGIAFYADLAALPTQMLFFTGFITGAGAIYFLVMAVLSYIIRFLSGVKDERN